jgi:hypothetical protein
MKAAAKWVTVRAAGRTFRRLVIAHLNRAQYDFRTGDMVQSFAARFRIIESGDYATVQADIPRSVQADMAHLGIFPADLTLY